MMSGALADPRSCEWEPNRPWSLWEMLRHDGAAFYMSSTSLAMTRTAVQYSVDGRQFSESHVLDQNEKINVQPQLRMLQQGVKSLGLDLAEISINGLLYSVELPGCSLTVGKMLSVLQEIEGRIRDGLLSVVLLTLSRDEAALFEPKDALFGNRGSGQIFFDNL
jgi:hypothetical protein